MNTASACTPWSRPSTGARCWSAIPTCASTSGTSATTTAWRPRCARGTAGAWIYQAAALIDRYPNVYADLSNSPLVYDVAYAARLVVLLSDVMPRYPKVKRRLMYGSDWWLSGLDPDREPAVGKFRATLGGLLGPTASPT